MSSCIWTWVGLFFVAGPLCLECRLLFDKNVSDTTHGFALMIALVFGSIFTALVHRLRRLYIYFAFRRYRWWIPALIVAGLIGCMMFADNERRNDAYTRSGAYEPPSLSSPRTPPYYPPNPIESGSERQPTTYPTPPPNSPTRLPGVSGYGGPSPESGAGGGSSTSIGNVGGIGGGGGVSRGNGATFSGSGSGRGNGGGGGGGL